MKHQPLVAWSRQELTSELHKHKATIKALEEELTRRGDRDEKRYGYSTLAHSSASSTQVVYATFADFVDAHAAIRKEFPGDDSAPYRIHPVYLGKDDK
jgi:hypothetical protein